MMEPRNWMTMLDITYIAVAVVFFGLMVAFVRGCDHLGRTAADEEPRS